MPPSPLSATSGRLAPFLLALVGCVPSTENLEINAAIADATLTVKPSDFGTAAEPQGFPAGTFSLVLTLGQLADQATDVTPQQFALVRASDQALLLASVPVQATAPTVIRVNVGETQKFTYTFAYESSQPLNPLCQAGQVQFTGVVLDGAQNNKPKPIRSTPITVAGCP